MPKKRNKFHYVRQRNPHIKRGAPVLYDGQLMFVSTVDGGDVILRRELRVHPCDDHAVYVGDEVTGLALDLIRNVFSYHTEQPELVEAALGLNEGALSDEKYQAILTVANQFMKGLARGYMSLPKPKRES